MMDYIQVKDIMFKYDDEPVLSDVSFHISEGEFVSLTGENGAAKSTLLKIVLGLLKPASGEVTRTLVNTEGKKFQIGYLPQQVASFNEGFPSTVIELVRSGRFQRGKWFKRLSQTDHEKVEEALRSVDMWKYKDAQIGELSGGQKQRICMARVLAAEPDLFVLDEPTTGMDKENRKNFYKLMRHYADSHNRAILMVTHDDEDLTRYVDRELRLTRKEDTEWRCFCMNSCSAHSSQEH